MSNVECLMSDSVRCYFQSVALQIQHKQGGHWTLDIRLPPVFTNLYIRLPSLYVAIFEIRV